jgi:ElaB/YqjD/DUF883 family membrane-anchored ribosome-binding protein
MSTQSRIEIESHKDPAQLEREIEAKRAEIAGLVSALERRLSPGEIVDRVLGYARGHGGELAGNLGASVKANPVPMLLTGLGLAWMMVNQHRGSQYASGIHAGAELHAGSHSGVRDRASQLRQRAAGKLGSARQRVGDTTHRAGDALHRAGDAAHRAGSAVRDRASEARQGFDQMLLQQPLAVGAIGIAIGALLGGLLPPTQREDALLGSASDRARERARSLAADGLDRANERLSESGGDAGPGLGVGGGNGRGNGHARQPGSGAAPPF